MQLRKKGGQMGYSHSLMLVLNNLRQEETKDGLAMMELSSFPSSVTEGISDLLKNKYKIVNGLSWCQKLL